MTDPWQQQPLPPNPYSAPPPGWTYPPQPPRHWYRAPGSVTGAATFTAITSWATVVVIGLGWTLVHAVPTTGINFLFKIFVVGLAFVALVCVGLVTGALAVAGAIATIPLAVAWLRTGDRSSGPVGALATASVGWLVMLFLVIRLGIIEILV